MQDSSQKVARVQSSALILNVARSFARVFFHVFTQTRILAHVEKGQFALINLSCRRSALNQVELHSSHGRREKERVGGGRSCAPLLPGCKKKGKREDMVKRAKERSVWRVARESIDANKLGHSLREGLLKARR